MKLYVKQMHDWNSYAFFAENVEEAYLDYFKTELWWQLGNNFIKTFDNIPDFSYCAENFSIHGETAIMQKLKLIPSPWKKALDLLLPEMKKLDIDWYINGSAAMALQGIDVAPTDLNIIVANYSDFDKVRQHFYKLAIKPFQRCDNWLMSGLGSIFLEAEIGFAFHNRQANPYDMNQLKKISYRGEPLFLSTLEMLKQDNLAYGRLDRVQLIDNLLSSK